MSQDLRELFKKEREKRKPTMSEGHEERFLKLLQDEFPKKKKTRFYLLKIAATVLLLITAGYFGYKKYSEKTVIQQTIVEGKNERIEQNAITLGDLSPDLKKVEHYYVANINLELAKLQVSDDNKGLIDSFMSQLENLDSEYLRLNNELNKMGPNDQTISALIKNLQLRLQLLQKLKKKLNNLNTSKNEQVETNTI